MRDNVALEQRALSEMIIGFIYGFYLDLPQVPHDLEPSFEYFQNGMFMDL